MKNEILVKFEYTYIRLSVCNKIQANKNKDKLLIKNNIYAKLKILQKIG